jgi:pyrimidine-nucleoside phosphorylase
MQNPTKMILKKRDGEKLTPHEINDFIGAYLKGDVPEYQMSAMLMAIYMKGMEPDEIAALTDVYIKSGDRIDFPKDMQTVDKHSTGGVGDKISLMLAPLVASFGVHVPMISGRGLGHTGGTLDKLESIPGFKTDVTSAEFKRLVIETGLSIIGQTDKLVLADKRIYALRDVTATVESLPLITASIMSKKIAEGAKNLVVDLKVGKGAFMDTIEKAQQLAELLMRTGEKFGQKVTVVFTNMNAPLGFYSGNALEVIETIDYLKGRHIPDVDLITRALAAEMLLMTGVFKTHREAFEKAGERIADGTALEYWKKMLLAQGADLRVIDDYSLFPVAKYQIPVIAHRSGEVKSIDSRGIGYALIDIKAGRRVLTDTLDYSAGAMLTHKIGDGVVKGEDLGLVYCNDKAVGEKVAEAISQCYDIIADEVESQELIIDIWR